MSYRSLAKFSQLVLLMFFIVQCGAIEYYVKPADNVTCPPPSQTCLTINQYTDPSNNYLQQNNTVFTFLPGKHVMERSMEFNNVENIILQSIKDDDGDYPQLIPRYILCSSEEILIPYTHLVHIVSLHLPYCSTIQMKEVLNVTISGLMIGAAVNISGIIIEHSIDIHIQQNIISSNDNLVNDTYGVGISIINGSNQITVDSLQTSNVLFGVLIWEVNDVIIHNSSFHNCHYSGLYIHARNKPHQVTEPSIKS